jgi:hypothetical protein
VRDTAFYGPAKDLDLNYQLREIRGLDGRQSQVVAITIQEVYTANALTSHTETQRPNTKTDSAARKAKKETELQSISIHHLLINATYLF